MYNLFWKQSSTQRILFRLFCPSNAGVPEFGRIGDVKTASVPSDSPMQWCPDWYADCVPLPIPPTSSGRARFSYLIGGRLAASAAFCISVDHWSPQRFSGLPGSTSRATPGAVAIRVRTRNVSPSVGVSIFQLGKNSFEPVTTGLRAIDSLFGVSSEIANT